MPSRRQIILGAGTGVALVGGGLAWRVTRVPRTATLPWDGLAAPVADVRLDALRHAILAPNPHNRQPWLIRLVGPRDAVISCDLDRRLPATDPHDRQTLIGFGCFAELARIAATRRGQRVEITAFPDGEPGPRLDARPIARLRFVADDGVRPDPLAAVIAARRSTKEPYDSRPVPAALLGRIAALSTAAANIGFATDPARLAPIRETITRAFEIETRTPHTYRESVDLMRITAPEIDANPDGIDLGGPIIEGLALAGQISREQLAYAGSAAFAQGLEQQLGVYGSLPAALWLTTPGNSRADQFAAGRSWVRVNLLATALGLKLHPVSQALQEYPEMAPEFARIHRLLGADGNKRVQMLARIGYGPATPPAPRWPLESHFRA